MSTVLYSPTYTVEKVKNVYNVSTDRILSLKPIDDKIKDVGLLDKRLFTGDNNLHAVQDSGLWFVKYDHGALPGFLNQKFTNFNQLLKYVTSYFKSRNVEVKEVIS